MVIEVGDTHVRKTHVRYGSREDARSYVYPYDVGSRYGLEVIGGKAAYFIHCAVRRGSEADRLELATIRATMLQISSLYTIHRSSPLAGPS
eukprot:scaffold264158_cov33-Prasinocladus_malaysianus.AAC.3